MCKETVKPLLLRLGFTKCGLQFYVYYQSKVPRQNIFRQQSFLLPTYRTCLLVMLVFLLLVPNRLSLQDVSQNPKFKFELAIKATNTQHATHPRNSCFTFNFEG